MGKSKRKRKIKEEDFKKKKLKVGKRLPMPDNLTKISFKAGTINILQNKDGDEVNFNLKRQNVKDFLSSCSHYNTQAREEALLGIKDLIEKQPNVLKDNLNNIFQKILGKITDIEFSVRRAFLSLISSVFKILSTAEIAPFFPSVVAHLCSAMTHLTEGVRMDSMKYLDHCLNFYPQLLSRYSRNVIHNFLDVISSGVVTQCSSKKPGSSKNSLKAKVTSQNTQLKVLSRLNRLLHVMFLVYHDDSGDMKGGGEFSGSSEFSGVGSIAGSSGGDIHGSFAGGCNSDGHSTSDAAAGHGDGPTGVSSTSGGHDSNFYGIAATSFQGTSNNLHDHSNRDGISTTVNNHTPGTFTASSLVSNFSLKTNWGDSTNTSDLLGNELDLMEFITSLSSILFEYWIECCPAEFTMNLIPVSKTSISLQIMKVVLEIFVTLVESLERITSDEEVFLKFVKDSLFGRFNNHFMSVFPMSFTIQQARSRKKKDAIAQSISDVTLNLLICKLMCYVMPEEDNDTFPKWVTNIFSYLGKVMVDKSKGSDSQASLSDIKTLTKLIKVLLFNLPSNYNNLKVQLFQNMYQLFTASHAMSNTKKVLLNFLEDILQSFTNHPVSPELKTTLDIWLCSLPKLLSNKDLGASALNNIFTVCKLGIVQNFPNIGASVTAALPCHILKAERFLAFGKETQALIIDILYHLKQAPSKQLYEVLSIVCNSGSLSLPVIQYLMQVVYQLANPEQQNEVSEISNYLSFVLSVIVGHSQENLTKLQTIKSLECFSHPVSEANTLVTDPKCILKEGEQNNIVTLKKTWKYQTSVNSIVCQYIALTEYSECIGEMMKHPLTKLFERYSSLPITVVYNLLYLVKVLVSLAKSNSKVVKKSSLFESHLAKWCALIWHFILSLETDSTNFEFFQSIACDVKELIKQLLKTSCNSLQSLLEFLQACTAHSGNNSTLSCKLVTEMLKTGVLQGNNDQPQLESIQINLESAFNAGMVESQVFSDFKYQYSCSV